ncbi:MAG: FAD-dependent oxidoreductase [Pseudomonadota bacterium]
MMKFTNNSEYNAPGGPAISPSDSRLEHDSRIAIIGGGPAGLSLARLLREQGFTSITVFEALSQVGGKSFTYLHGDTVVEMGTCYATLSHKVTNRWMKEFGLKMTGLKEQRFAGDKFTSYIRKGPGPNLFVQLYRYWTDKAKLQKALKTPNPPQWALEQAAMPIGEWLSERELGKIEHFMHRSTTNIAYGFVDEASTVQALDWNDMKLLITGLLKQLKMPEIGWAEFWNMVAADLDVRLNSRVKEIDRSGSSIRVSIEDGDAFEFDQLVCAIPLDDFGKLAQPTQDEDFVIKSVRWNGYTTTLFTADNWFTDVDTESYKEAVLPGAELGQLLSARHDGFEPDLGGNVYLSGQLSGDYTSDELKEILREDLTRKGATVTNIILQKMWKYHSFYDFDAIRNGLLQTLKTMQGRDRTWYTGATFSYEAVSHITNFNAQLARDMQAVTLTS